MKNIFLLMLIMGVFSPLINAYEYLVYSSGGTIKEAYFLNDNGNYFLKIFQNGNYSYSQRYDYVYFNNIKYGRGSSGYISKNEFDLYFTNDLNFLNDLYTSSDYNRNGFLNYLYNDSIFNSQNYINYENYELLYNSDGLVVESIVNGDWAGLYDESELNKSGFLYNKKGELVYRNGVPANWMEKLFDKFKFNKIMNDSLTLYGSACLIVVIVCGIVVFIERFTDFSLIALIGRLGK